jgi:hypothetical protein
MENGYTSPCAAALTIRSCLAMPHQCPCSRKERIRPKSPSTGIGRFLWWPSPAAHIYALSPLIRLAAASPKWTPPRRPRGALASAATIRSSPSKPCTTQQPIAQGADAAQVTEHRNWPIPVVRARPNQPGLLRLARRNCTAAWRPRSSRYAPTPSPVTPPIIQAGAPPPHPR